MRRSSRKLIGEPPSAAVRRGIVGSACGSKRSAVQSAVGRVEPADDGIQSEQFGIGDQGELEIEVSLVLFETRPLLHQLDEVAPVDLDDVVHVDPRNRSAERTLITSSSRGGDVMSGGVLSHVDNCAKPDSVMSGSPFVDPPAPAHRTR